MMTLSSSGYSGSMYGIGTAMRRRSTNGASSQEMPGLQFNTGLLPSDTNAIRISDGKVAKILAGYTVRIYTGQMGATNLPVQDEAGNKYWLMELAPQGPGEYWAFYRDSPAAKATIEGDSWAQDVQVRNDNRLFWTMLSPGSLAPYDPDKIVDSYTGPFGPENDADERGLEDAVAAGKSKTPTSASTGAGDKLIGGKTPGGSGSGGGGGGTGSGGIDIGIPGLGLGPNITLPDIGSGIVILLLLVVGGLLLTNKALRG